MEPRLSIYLAGLRTKHNIQQALPKMIETWRSMLNKGNKGGAIILDFPKHLTR